MLMTYGAEERAAGKYIRNVELIRGWYDEKSTLSMRDAAKFARIPLSVFEGVINLIKEHPDWDDETVANKANWR